jgi:hypothetical protein
MATFKGDMPIGWTLLLTYWSKRPVPNFFDIPERDLLRGWRGDAGDLHSRSLSEMKSKAQGAAPVCHRSEWRGLAL